MEDRGTYCGTNERNERGYGARRYDSRDGSYSTLRSQWVHIHRFPHNDSCSSPSKVLGGENVQDLDVLHFGGQVLHIGLSVDQSVPLPITTSLPSSVSSPHIVLAIYRIVKTDHFLEQTHNDGQLRLARYQQCKRRVQEHPKVLLTRSAKHARAHLDGKIPNDWRIEINSRPSGCRNVFPVFGSAKILSTRELEITSAEDATYILKHIHEGSWSAEEVTIAFCKRAAVAHQLVHCLMDADFTGAIQRARELDQYQRDKGAIVGPLHGLPVSLKVCLPSFLNWISRF